MQPGDSLRQSWISGQYCLPERQVVGILHAQIPTPQIGIDNGMRISGMQASRTALVGAMMCLAALLPGGQAHAQGLDSAYAAAFAARIANPGDTATLGAFIDIAVREGQYDQALSTTEQHLIDHPRDAKARLIAGRLYNHLGSYELARRQLNHALEIGTLSPEETAEAQDLLGRVERAIEGWSYSVEATAGVRAEWIDLKTGNDRDDLDPFGELSATVRQDLKTATRDAIIYSASIAATRRFYDVDLAANAGRHDHIAGRGAITWDKGLPDFGIDSLRMLLTGYVRGETFDTNTDEVEYGTSVRFTVRPTVDSFAFAGVGYGWISESTNIIADERFRWEAGFSHRISGSWSLGIGVQGSQDFANGNKVGEMHEVEASVGGVVYTIPDRLVWTYQLGVALGERESPDLSFGLPFMVDSDYWRVSSRHRFQIGEKQYISLETTWTDVDYSSALSSAVDRTSLETMVSYTHIFN